MLEGEIKGLGMPLINNTKPNVLVVQNISQNHTVNRKNTITLLHVL